MSSQIPGPIGVRKYEEIRDRIVDILAVELNAQSQLDYDDQLFELPDVYMERFVPFHAEEMPAVNVMLAQGQYTQETQVTQDGTYTFFIDVYQKAKSSDGQRGDQYATMRLHRCLGIIQAVLMDSRYVTLLFDRPSISNRRVTEIKITDPGKAMEAASAIMGRVTFEVRCPEEVELVDAIPLADYITQVKMSSTGAGYKFSGESTFVPVEPCDPAVIINSDGTLSVTVPSGETKVLDDITLTVNSVPQGTFPAGVDLDVTVVAPGVTITVDGALTYSNPPSGGSFDVSVKYANGTPVGTIITETDALLDIQVPNNVTPINTANLYKTGNITSYTSGDDGDLDRGRGTDFLNLDWTNPYGNTKAYTGVGGGYYDENTDTYKDVNGNTTTEALAFPDEILLNWKTYDQVGEQVFGIKYTPNNGAVNTMIQNAPYTVGSYTGFYACNWAEVTSFMLPGQGYNVGGVNIKFWDWKPLSFVPGSGGSNQRLYSSSYVTSSTVLGWASNFVQNFLTHTSTGNIFIGKYFTLTELGL